MSHPRSLSLARVYIRTSGLTGSGWPGVRHFYDYDGRIQEREGFEPSEPVKALQFSRLLH